MARNVEIRARVADPPAMRCLVRSLTGSPPEVLVQRDTFFRVAGGRLKLREMEGRPAELIGYDRPDRAGPKTSVYTRTPVADPGGITMRHSPDSLSLWLSMSYFLPAISR